MPLVCAFVPAFKVAVARRADPELGARPVAIADRLERGRIVAVDQRAAELGARAGMTIAQASATLATEARAATILADDPARNRAVWETVLDALDVASPLIEDAGEGTAFIEMRGIAGTPVLWLTTIRDAVDACGLPVRIGFAATKFVARVAAGIGDRTIVALGDEAAFLAPLPLGVLGLEAEIEHRLELLGIRNLGELAALPHGPFVRRFGKAAARWHALARGDDPEPLLPRPRALRIERSLYGEGSAEREDQLLFALRTLVARVAEDLARLGKRCGRARVQLECEDGELRELLVALAEPTAQAATLFELIRVRLEGVALRSPVIGLRLGAERLEAGGSPLGIFATGDPDPQVLAVALARLDAALGADRAHRAHAAGLPVPAESDGCGTLTYRALEPCAIVVRVEHNRPAFVGLSSGDAVHRVVDLAGPWRSAEQWGSTPKVWDEYDVALTDGSLRRIACVGGHWFVVGEYD